MLIGGYQKFSLIDYPGKISAIIFTQGCPFRCHFCHNPSLVLPHLFKKPIDLKKIFTFLESRKNQLEGIVITGGEPTIQKNLFPFIQKIKNLGFSIKLDTSGINPNTLKVLIEHHLLDYVAMDIKAPLDKYETIIDTNINVINIEKSIDLLFSSSINFEFRTTIIPSLHSPTDIINIAKMIKQAPLYTLQRFIANSPLNSSLKHEKSFPENLLLSLQKEVENYVKKCIVK